MLALSGPALAAETTLTADLAGDAATDADGTGSAKITLDPDAGTACWELTAEGIEPVTQSHIHVGAEGESGDVVVAARRRWLRRHQRGLRRGPGRRHAPGDHRRPVRLLRQPPHRGLPGGAIRGQLVGASEPPNTALPVSDGSTALLGAILLALAAAIGLRTWRPLATRD